MALTEALKPEHRSVWEAVPLQRAHPLCSISVVGGEKWMCEYEHESHTCSCDESVCWQVSINKCTEAQQALPYRQPSTHTRANIPSDGRLLYSESMCVCVNNKCPCGLICALCPYRQSFLLSQSNSLVEEKTIDVPSSKKRDPIREAGRERGTSVQLTAPAMSKNPSVID